MKKIKVFLCISLMLASYIQVFGNNSQDNISTSTTDYYLSKQGDKNNNHYPFALQPLPYNYDALMPYIDAETMELHHNKHLQSYIDKLNSALKDHPKYHSWSLEQLLYDIDKLPQDIQLTVQNNGGGVYNHNLFFSILAKDTPIENNSLRKAIFYTFGTFEKFEKEFKEASLSVFGSGWTWLVSDYNGNLSIQNTKNQDTLIKENLIPIIAIDVWEHAYYLKYQNRRSDYIDNWFNAINWRQAEINYAKYVSSNKSIN